MERLRKSAQRTACGGVIIAFAPALQGLGIIEPEADTILPREASGSGQRLESRLVEQQAAWEDVGLNEVRIARVAVEQAMIHRDELERRAARWLQVAGYAVEISTPPAPPNRLDHFHRRNGIELFGGLPIIGQSDVNSVRKPSGAGLFVCPAFLFA